MLNIPPEILELTKEAVALARGDRIIYLNPAARELLGNKISGKSIRSAFGPEIAGTQAACFMGSATIKGRSFLVRVTKQEDVQAFFFSPPELNPTLINDALIYALRGSMMTESMAMDLCRSRSDRLEDKELSLALASLTKSQYALNRMLGNLALVQEYLKDGLFFDPMSFDLAAFAREYTESLQFLRPDVTISFKSPEKLSIAADPALVEQLLSNLISNCLLHGHGCSHISVSIINGGESAILSVIDNGCGMAPQLLHSVFERYRHLYQVSELGGGAGLGLTVVRAIAEKHGGTLLLESREGAGTTVRVSLRKKLPDESLLRCREQGYGGEIKKLLLGLAGCLDDEYYRERYMD